MSRLIIVLSFVFGLSLVSCEKYQLKQPSYLNFKWDCFNQQEGPGKAYLEGGYFYVNRVTLKGTRKKGPEIAIEQSLPPLKTTFKQFGDLNISVDVPVGDYTDFSVDLNIVEQQTVCMTLNGTYNDAGNIYPFRMEWTNKSPLIFHTIQQFTLKKKYRHDMTIGIDTKKLFENIDWSFGTLTNEAEGLMYVIRENNNVKLYEDLTINFPKALILTVK